VQLNSPLGYGDQIGLRAVVSENLASLRGQAAFPLGSQGLRLALHASELRYRLGGSFASLEAKGTARSLGGALTWPLLRTTTRNLSMNLGLEQRRADDDSLGLATRRRRMEAATLALRGDRIDGIPGAALSQGAVQITHGRLTIGDVGGDLAADLAGPVSRGDYQKFTLHLSRLQNLAEDWLLSAALSSQWASKNLDSSEKFALGGPWALRAYPVNEAAGDEGWLVNLEMRRGLHKILGAGWQALVFADLGGTVLHRKPWAGWQGTGSTPNHYTLAGAGLGISWSRPGSWQFSATVAVPLGNNPGADAAGNNSDGSRAHAARGWLGLNRLF